MFNFIKILFYGTFLIIFNADNFNCVNGEKVRVVKLTNSWKLQNQNGTIQLDIMKIPMGVYTALSDQYGDVLHSKNDLDLRWISHENWTFSINFNVNPLDYNHVRSVNLTLHGIDTIATIRLNSVVIGHTDNMFVRYSYDVLPYLLQENILEIEIMSPVLAAIQFANVLSAKNLTAPPDCPKEQLKGECHQNLLRKLQMSFGSKLSLAAPSLGIWKPVTLEYYEVGVMRDVDVAIDQNATHWFLDIRISIDVGMQTNFFANITLFAPDLLEDRYHIGNRLVLYMAPRMEFRVPVPKNKVIMWWPNGYGPQKLYPLLFSLNCWMNLTGPNIRSRTISQKSLKIGFRKLELIEDVDEFGRSFYFKVNDRPIFIKGANYMPIHILPELSNDQDKIRHILQSAKEAHINMIRVWGGGLYESDYFYSLADYYGLLVWQDMAFTKSTYPITDEFLNTVCVETVQNAKRLAYHPSLTLIVTNNEIELYLVKMKSYFGTESSRLEDEYKQLFVGTIRHELNAISRYQFNPRPGPMVSTPSMGTEENGLPLNPQDPKSGDLHFWEEQSNAFNLDIYPRGRFISEYGFQSFPQMNSWMRSLKANDSIDELVIHRQHNENAFVPMIQLIQHQLPMPPGKWPDNFDSWIYLSQVAQAMATKTATQLYRSHQHRNQTMGVLYFHLNDVWIAPTWSAIDFYGNYKVVYYWLKEFLAPNVITALYDARNRVINVTLVRDIIPEDMDASIYDVTINTYLWSDLYAKATKTRKVIWTPVAVHEIFIAIDSLLVPPYNKYNTFLEFVWSEKDTILANTFFFPAPISRAIGIQDPQLKLKLGWRYCNDDTTIEAHITTYSMIITIKHPAVFVYLEVTHPNVTKYRLSHNGFVQVNPVSVVHLEFEHKTECITISLDHIKVSTVNQFMTNVANDVNVSTTTTTTSTTAAATTPHTTSSTAFVHT